MTHKEQLDLWVKGESVHGAGSAHMSLVNTGKEWRCVDCGVTGTSKSIQSKPCPKSEGECCPDFSCCQPSMAVQISVREAFVAASPKDREKFLMGFLGGVVQGKNVYIAGQGEKS